MLSVVSYRRIRRILAYAVLAGTVGALAACGGGSSSGGDATTASAGTTASGSESVAASAWVKDFCGALTTWKSTLTTNVPDFSNVSDVASVKTTLADYLGNVVDSTKTLVSDVQAAGTPDVPDGEAIVADLKAELTKVGDAFANAKSEVAALPTDDVSALTSGLTKISDEITDAGDDASDALGDLDEKYPNSSALSEAAANEPTCTSLSS